MESQDPMDQFAELAEVVLGAYVHLAQLLAALPIPVELPRLVGDPNVEAFDALLALEKAREIIADEPLGHLYQRSYDKLILEWTTVYELMALIKHAGPARWRLDGVRAGLIRFGLTAEMIENGELDELE